VWRSSLALRLLPIVWLPAAIAIALVLVGSVHPVLMVAALLISSLLVWRLLHTEVLAPVGRLSALMPSRDEASTGAETEAPPAERRAGSFKRLASELELQLSALQEQVFSDPLTGLPNRIGFKNAVDVALYRAGAPGDGIAIMFMDLDNFKIVNDSLGHAAGDQLLAMAANRIRACLRTQDIAARVGGDEFNVLLPAINDPRTAASTAERLIEQFKEPFMLAGQEVFVSASIGIALGQTGRERPQNLLRNADLALYRAKDKGKAGYVVFDESLRVDVADRLHLETDLRRALERGQFRVVYQPIVSLTSWKVEALEALLRWDHPERGLLAAGDFIGLAEETGILEPIGRWMLGESFRQMQLLAVQARTPLPVLHVNLSARELQNPRLVGEVAGILRRSGYPPSNLRIEITESSVLGASESNLIALHELRQLGLGLALDDFGTGYSSLSYLNLFPIDMLKLDRVFVAGIGRTERDRKILEALVGLARTLNLALVAEGIETAEQVSYLRSLGCDYGQGYYCAKPMPITEIGRRLLAA
jgi:diguanylate cyclase (GGDEF)-like protein